MLIQISSGCCRWTNALTVFLCLFGLTLESAANQEALEPLVNAKSDRELSFDWPILRVATGEYAEGPTGVTVFHFARKVNVAIDTRGGGPGTVNADYMQLGYDLAELDAVVFAGGSWYGLEATTAVASALKDDGLRDGDAFSAVPNIAMSVGSIIFDFGARRLNEIYPDKRLAQATFREAKTGAFPLGAHGAGRFAMSGGFFGCNAYGGQGAAFQQIGEVKIAVFTVVNAFGVITDRGGNVAACYPAKGMQREPLKAAKLLSNFMLENTQQGSLAEPGLGDKKNTTISLVVTNQKLSTAELQRLAVQVHTSMARSLQPFATQFDGDVLYAVSTAELEEQRLLPHNLGVIAGELMWDAILSSVPEQPALPVAANKTFLSAKEAQALAGDYRFSEFVSIRVTARGRKLYAQALGKRNAYVIGKEQPVELQPISATEFMVPSRYPLKLNFSGEGKLVINPGHWQQVAQRQGITP